MRASTIALALIFTATGAAASAQGYQGYSGYQTPKVYALPKAPEPPKPPRPPEFRTEPRFKPFKGEHLTSPRGGLDPYPAPKKPKGGFSTYGE